LIAADQLTTTDFLHFDNVTADLASEYFSGVLNPYHHNLLPEFREHGMKL